jgi:hypothetical protein
VRSLVAAVVAAIAVIGLILLLTEGGEGEHTANERAATQPSPGDVWSGAGYFGTNAPLLRAYTRPDQTAALNALAGSMSAAGLSWARIVFDQAVEQRLQGETNWSIPDRVVGTLAAHGVRTEALFVGTAGWAATLPAALSCGEFAYPADISAWSRFVGAAVERYGRGGTFWAEHPEITALPIETWEVGNEENLRMFWCPEADPRQYAEVYRASRLAAHSADDDAHVIVGGLAPAFAGTRPAGDLGVADFLKRMIDAEPALAHQIPAVAIHLYAPTAELVLLELRLYRQALAEAGLGRTPMIVNEIGWHTSGPHDSRFATEARRAALIRGITTVSRETNCNLVGFGVHGWVTAQADPGNAEDWYGLADPRTGAPNESGRAYAAGIAASDAHRTSQANGKLSHLCG